MARPEAREFGGTRWWLGGMFISMRGIKTGGGGGVDGSKFARFGNFGNFGFSCILVVGC